jgi:peptide chain release factor subunit 1
MTTTTSASATELRLPEAVVTLERTPAPTGRVLSVYLDSSPGRIAGHAYLLAYRDAIRALRATLGSSEHTLFETAAAQAEAYVSSAPVAHHHGLAVFASGDESYLYAVGLADAPPERVDWDSKPRLAPLERIVDDNERIVVALFDSERARIFSVFMGAIELEQQLHDDVPSKQATGGWYSLAQTHMSRHREDHVRRHADRTVHALMRLLRERSFDRLLVAGPDEALTLLRRELPRPLRTRLAGELQLELSATETQVLSAARDAAEMLERVSEKHVVDELMTGGAHAVVGLDETLCALADGRVHLLVVANTFHTPGARCTACGRLTAYVHHCPACGSATTPLSDLCEAVVAEARSHGGRVEFVSGAADRRLEDHGGIGAWTRY